MAILSKKQCKKQNKAKASKKKSKHPKPPIVNGFKCKICGQIIAPLKRSTHLIVAHKLSGSNLKDHYIDTGKRFSAWQSNKSASIMERYNRNLSIPEKDYEFESEGPRPIKIIYTPMGNRR